MKRIKKSALNLLMKSVKPAWWRTQTHAVLVIITIITATSCASAQQNSADVEWLIDVLQLTEGSVVADIGAGEGDQTLAISRHVGANGHVYSTELGEESLEELRETIERADVENVTVLEGSPTQTNLPGECCNAIYLRRVYHHIGNPSSMNLSMLESLKPGGRLAIIDFEPSGDEAEPGARASGDQHGVTPETVIEELENVGFEVISPAEERGRYYYLVFQKPE